MNRPMMVATHAAFLLTGTVTTLLGPLLPVLASRWSLDDGRAGYMFAAQFAGSMLGVAFSARLATRFGFPVAMAIGLMAMAVGVGGLVVLGWPSGLLAIACYGWGLGVTIPATNLLVAEAAPDRRAEAVNLLNLAWGAGAVASPPVLAWCAAHGRTNAFLLVLSVSLVMLVAVQLSLREAAAGRPAARDEPHGTVRRVAWTSSAFIVYGALFYVYVGTENAVAGWIAAFAQRVDATAVAVATPSLFWAGLLTGRAAAPLLLRRLTEPVLVQAGLVVAAVGVTLILGSTTLRGIMVSTTLCGIGLSTVFPTTIAQLTRRFADASPAAAASAFALAGLGGATVPWLVGISSSAAGDLRAGLIIPLVGCLLMMALHGYRARC